MRLAIVSILISFWGNTQTTFQWYEGSCLRIGKIDTVKYTYEQVQNCYYFFIEPTDLQASIFLIKQTDTNGVKQAVIQKECEQFLQSYSEIKLPNTPFWQQTKLAYQSYLNRLCYLREKVVEANYFPKKFKIDQECLQCELYSKAIRKGRKLLLQTWEKVIDEQLKGALDSASIANAYQIQKSSKEKYFFARQDVLKYGWWNCMMQHEFKLPHQEMKESFEKMFTEISITCQ